MSVGRNFFLIERRGRLTWLMDLMNKHPDLPFSKIKGLMILKTGIKGNTVDEYIRDLLDAGIIEWNEEKRNYFVLLSKD